MTVNAIRDGPTLKILHPCSAIFSCTEDECDVSFNSSKWHFSRVSLERHLKEWHGIVLEKTINKCKYCNILLGTRPTLHKCDQAPDHTDEPNQEPQTFPWKCTQCEMSFPSRQGLRNHNRQHDTAQKRVAVNVELPRPRTGRGRQSRHLDIGSPASGINIANTQTSNTNTETQTSLHNYNLNNTQSSIITHTPNFTHVTQINIDSLTSTTQDAEAPISSSDPRTDTEDAILSNITESQAIDDVSFTLSNSTSTADNTVISQNPVTNDFLLKQFITQLQVIARHSATQQHWESFLLLLQEIETTVQQAMKISLLKSGDARENVNKSTPDPEDARYIQRLYRVNRRRAMRLIVGEQSVRCSADTNTVADYFEQIWSSNNTCNPQFENAQDRTTINDTDFTPLEVWTKLSKSENTAPGPDRITYNHWKQVDPESQALAIIFTICKKYQKVPSSWKKTSTILIHKKGSLDDFKNWRPIALSSTIYKLYAGCWATRLIKWINDNNAIHPAQKGFMAYDGVLEHNFAIKTIIADARRGSRELCVAWLDLSNAFGSVPHSVVLGALNAAGIGNLFHNIINNILQDSTTQILTERGLTRDIDICSGVKQGCPLSGLLFNLAIDHIIRQLNDENCQVLAYADDLALLCNSTQLLQEKLQTANNLMCRVKMSFNANKSRTLHIGHINRTQVRVIPTLFNINRSAIPCVQDEQDHESFLGAPIGFSPVPSNAKLNDIIATGLKVLTSKLAPWQRIDAFKTFIMPSTLHLMRLGVYDKNDWDKLDRIFRAEIKKTLYVPTQASNEYLYGPRVAGLIGIPVAADMADSATLDSAFKLLTSRDDKISELAAKDLDRNITIRTKQQADDDLRARFLSGDMTGSLNSRATGLKNIWTQTRKVSNRNNITWNFTNSVPTMITPEGKRMRVTDRTKIMSSIRKQKQDEYLQRLLNLESQGKAIECVATSALNSHFLTDGAYTRFAEWRFIHRARLNLVPLNANKHTTPGEQRDTRCRRCNYQLETLPHVLHHCMRYSHAFQLRHNAIVNRIRNAARLKYRVLAENQAIGGTMLRPDLLLVRGRDAKLVDITVVAENRLASFQAAREEKIAKYQTLIPILKNSYDTISIEPIVVGSLGSWDPNNDKFLRSICTKRYGRLMKKLVTSDTIRWSRDIYVEHLTGHRQWTQPADNPSALPSSPIPATPDES